jgi:TPP-dependent pyruvate/acetoin dehydrogenase alpha subunit
VRSPFRDRAGFRPDDRGRPAGSEVILEPTKSDLSEMYRLMVLTRSFEERARQWYLEGRIIECPHSSVGQEAIGVGACFPLRPEDVVIPSLRTRAAFFARGVPLKEMVATMAGKRSGFSRGRDTSHHAGLPQWGIMAGTGVVGGSILPSVGAALAMKVRQADSVVLSFFGDGASNEGAFHEGLNFAGVQRLAIVFVCENNQWAQATSLAESTAIEDIAVRAGSYGFPGVVIDGNDVLQVCQASQLAIEQARRGKGPTLIECKTLRWRPHCELGIFEELWKQEAAEVERWQQRDPIPRLGSRLLEEGICRQEDLQQLEEKMGRELDAAILAAEGEPDPEAGEAQAGVYAA